MERPRNRAAIKEVKIHRWNLNQDVLHVTLTFFPSNNYFHKLSILQSTFFRRLKNYTDPTYEVMLNGPQDAIINQVAVLLSTMESTSIKSVIVGGMGDRTTAVFDIIKQLLQASTIQDLRLSLSTLNDDSATFVHFLADRIKMTLSVTLYDLQLTDQLTAAFLSQLTEKPVSSVILRYPSSSSSFFFGLTKSVWEYFINQKFYRSFEWIKVTSEGVTKQMKNADLPDTPIESLQWMKVN